MKRSTTVTRDLLDYARFARRAQLSGLHACFLLGVLSVTFFFPALLWAQDIAQIKKGVVKITAQVDGKNKIGSGIIVKLEEDHAYIVTASHVIEGDPQPNVMFFSAPHRPFRARVLGLEGGNPAGLAALLIEGKIPPGLQADRKASCRERVCT